jgi:hypothetical protein
MMRNWCSRELLAGLILAILLQLGFSTAELAAQAGTETPNAATASTAGAKTAPRDPDAEESELNHHIAGAALILIAILVTASHISPKLAFLQRLWPWLFVGAGIFLLAWSDVEIWPRGLLGWQWLPYDIEAMQHKMYGFLMIGLGLIEYFYAVGRLPGRWARWSFCVLAIFGGIFLFFHQHSGSKIPPEVNAHAVRHPHPRPPVSADASQGMNMPGMQMEGMDHGEMGHTGTEKSMAAGDDHHHAMTESMLKIKNEHFWFAIVGFAVALFKLLDYGKVKPYVRLLWPGAMATLGVLLLMYKE